MEFKSYKRKGFVIAKPYKVGDDLKTVSISEADKKDGSPKLGDMIAQNPDNPNDMWLISEEYFKKNYELETPETTFEQRLIEEERTLRDMFVKLKTFIDENPKFNELSKKTQTQLIDQMTYMEGYLRVLVNRMNDLGLCKNQI